MRRVLAIGAFALASVLFGAAAQGAPQAAGDYIVVLIPGADRAAAVRQAQTLGGAVSMRYRHALNGFAVRLPHMALAGIEQNPNVLFVAPDRDAEAAAPAPCVDPTQCQLISNGVNRIDGDLSSTKSGDGKGTVPVNVAIIDSGTGPHPDLNVVGGVDCTNGDGSFNDHAGHGTLVGGFVGALDNGFGRVGIASGASLYSVRVLDKHGHTTESRILCGIEWVTRTRADADPTNDIPVANMSIGGQLKNADDGNCGRTNKDALHLAICNSVASGVTYVVAAGNFATDVKDTFPSAYDEVLAATAMADWDGQPGGLAPAGPVSCHVGDPVDQGDDVFAWFSNFATTATDRAHTIAAPGVCIGSTYLNDGYAIATGTSFGSPLVAGTVALCIFSGPCAGLTPAQIIQKMVADATAYNTATKNSGYGFQGDPLRPISGKYYGYLIRAGLY